MASRHRARPRSSRRLAARVGHGVPGASSRSRGSRKIACDRAVPNFGGARVGLQGRSQCFVPVNEAGLWAIRPVYAQPLGTSLSEWEPVVGRSGAVGRVLCSLALERLTTPCGQSACTRSPAHVRLNHVQARSCRRRRSVGCSGITRGSSRPAHTSTWTTTTYWTGQSSATSRRPPLLTWVLGLHRMGRRHPFGEDRVRAAAHPVDERPAKPEPRRGEIWRRLAFEPDFDDDLLARLTGGNRGDHRGGSAHRELAPCCGDLHSKSRTEAACEINGNATDRSLL